MQIRARSIRVRIMSAHIFCNIVESEDRWASRLQARRSMEKVARLVAGLARDLFEPEHIPAQEIPALLTQLGALQARALELERNLARPPRRSRHTRSSRRARQSTAPAEFRQRWSTGDGH